MTQRSLWADAGCLVVEAAVLPGMTAFLRWQCCQCHNQNSPMRLECPGCKHRRCDNPKGHVPKNSKGTKR